MADVPLGRARVLLACSIARLGAMTATSCAHSSPLVIDQAVDGAQLVMRLAGSLDVVSAWRIRKPVLQAGRSGFGEVVLDMSSVTLVDAAGFGAIEGISEELARMGAHVVLRTPSDAVDRLLHSLAPSGGRLALRWEEGEADNVRPRACTGRSSAR